MAIKIEFKALGSEYLSVLNEAAHSIFLKDKNHNDALNLFRSQEIYENSPESLDFKELRLQGIDITMLVAHSRPHDGKTLHYEARIGTATEELREKYPHGKIISLSEGKDDAGRYH